MSYAVVQIGPHQYLVKPGDVLVVDRLPMKEGESFEIEKVLLAAEKGKTPRFGKPYVKGVTVTTKVVKVGKGKKIRVATFKAKSRSRRVLGFRPCLTNLEVIRLNWSKSKVTASKVKSKSLA